MSDNVVDKDKAGKAKFAHLMNKFVVEEQLNIPEKDKNEVMEKNDPQEITTKVVEVADNLIRNTKESSDVAIKKRRHPAYKGNRIPRTYKIPKELDERMDRIYETEGIEKQHLVIKAIEKYINDKYYDIN